MSNYNIDKTLKKAKRTMTMRIGIIVLLFILIIELISGLPIVLRGLQSNRVSEATRLIYSIEQFSNPEKITGYGNKNGESYGNLELSLFSYIPVGKSVKTNNTQIHSYNVFNGKVDYNYEFFSNFMHPDFNQKLDVEIKRDIDSINQTTLRSLKRNQNTTVAVVDVSFESLVDFKQLVDIASEYDLYIEWYAVETGYETYEPPKNIYLSRQQYYTFGIPRLLAESENVFNPYELKPNNVDEYLLKLSNTLDSFDKNKNLLANEIWFLDEGVSNNLKSGNVMVYGVRLNGPTSEVMKFIENNKYTKADIVVIDFYVW